MRSERHANALYARFPSCRSTLKTKTFNSVETQSVTANLKLNWRFDSATVGDTAKVSVIYVRTNFNGARNLERMEGLDLM